MSWFGWEAGLFTRVNWDSFQHRTHVRKFAPVQWSAGPISFFPEGKAKASIFLIPDLVRPGWVFEIDHGGSTHTTEIGIHLPTSCPHKASVRHLSAYYCGHGCRLVISVCWDLRGSFVQLTSFSWASLQVTRFSFSPSWLLLYQFIFD